MVPSASIRIESLNQYLLIHDDLDKFMMLEEKLKDLKNLYSKDPKMSVGPRFDSVSDEIEFYIALLARDLVKVVESDSSLQFEIESF